MNISLLEQTQCSKFLHTVEMTVKVKDIQSTQRDLRAIVAPSLDEILERRGRHYSYQASYDNNRWDPVLILHSSGSTGGCRYPM